MEKIRKDMDTPSSWEIVLLGDFVEHEKGKKPKSQQDKPSKEFPTPYIDIEAFEEGILKSWTNGYGCRLCSERDFLMVWDGSRSGLVGKGMNGALGSTLVRINFPYIENNYAYYFLQSKFLEINTRAKGTGTPHVDPDLLWNYSFPISPENEQKRIVTKIEELFSELDKGIENLKTAQEQLKVFRQAVLKHAFEGKLTAKWREENKDKLETADQLLERIKQEREIWLKSEVGNGNKEAKNIMNKIQKHKFKFPSEILTKGWVWTSLTDACQLVVDCHNKTAPYEGKGIYLVRTSNIRDGKIDLVNKIKYISEKTYQYWARRCHPKPGDILFTREAPMGEVAQISEGQRVCMGQRIMLLRVYQKYILGKYLLYNIMNPGFRLRMNKEAIGSGVKHLRVGAVESLTFPLCCFEEQRQIVKEIESKLSVVDQLELDIENQLILSNALRQSILKQAFSGKLVKQDPNDEPASALLERIKAVKAETEKTKTKKRKRNAA